MCTLLRASTQQAPGTLEGCRLPCGLKHCHSCHLLPAARLLPAACPVQCTFRQLQPSGMVTRLEGATTALPLRLPRGAGLASAKEHQLQLEEELRLATERFLCSIGVTKPGAKPLRLKSFDSSRRRSMDSSRTAAAQGGGASGGVAEGRSLDVGGSGTKRLSFEGGRHKLSSLSKPSLNALNIRACTWAAGAARLHGQDCALRMRERAPTPALAPACLTLSMQLPTRGRASRRGSTPL